MPTCKDQKKDSFCDSIPNNFSMDLWKIDLKWRTYILSCVGITWYVNRRDDTRFSFLATLVSSSSGDFVGGWGSKKPGIWILN